jgi:hypothetical protein
MIRAKENPFFLNDLEFFSKKEPHPNNFNEFNFVLLIISIIGYLMDRLLL